MNQVALYARTAGLPSVDNMTLLFKEKHFTKGDILDAGVPPVPKTPWYLRIKKIKMDMEREIFITTDKFPIFIGDTYYKLNDQNQVEIWKCDENDIIPTEETYKKSNNVEWVRRENEYHKNLLKRIPELQNRKIYKTYIWNEQK